MHRNSILEEILSFLEMTKITTGLQFICILPPKNKVRFFMVGNGKTCAVIGSGIAGLAAAIRIAAKGFKVTVYEANNYPGGKMRELRGDGFRFDMGPSVWMLPNLVDELFELCGKNPREYFTYSPIETTFKYFFEDGTVINGYADTEKLAQEVEAKTIDKREALEKYRKDIETKYNITNEVFIENSLHIFSNFFTRKMFTGLLNFNKIDAFKTMDEVNNEFFKDPKMVQLFNNYATYVGSNPFSTPATMNVIPHLEINLGAYLPDKGIYSIVTALVKLANEIGVEFKYNARVAEINVANGTVTGIMLENKERISYDRVVSDMDVYYTYTRLLPNEAQPKRILDQKKSSSMIGFFWGINRSYDELGIHNMFFAANDRAEYDAIFEDKTISSDPTIYLFITSKHVPGDAPKGCENWFLLITAPNIQGQDWNKLVIETRANVVAKINRLLHTDIEQQIVFEEQLTPIMIRENYSTHLGAIYGNSANSKFASFFRHPNFSKKVKGLYFVGGSVHPGAGMPLSLNSAKIVGKIFS